jgi:sigma-B regulation protein RsbU (phosphoserine phosphatase)
MLAAPIPKDDAERLEALHALGILDTPPEARFDRFTRLLTLALDVPMAYISLVDADRQWFKSSCGITAGETPRATSFCGHAILADEPMVVTDALQDERFHDNPMVTGDPLIRFYAGCPLTGPGGQRVGTLCIADRQPRTPRAAELEALRELARLVERELGLVEAVHLQKELIASQEHLARELAQAAAYVRSLLPGPTDGSVRTRWRFEPSSQLGGDCFGCAWIDADHFAMYLLDVSGHGVGAALLSVSVANTLRARSLPETDFRDPSAVLAALNDAFPMERNDDKYFTLWYGVYDRPNRRLIYAGAGHPPAILMSGTSPEQARAVEIGSQNLAIGILAGAAIAIDTVALEPYGKLLILSDGVYEVRKPDGTWMRWEELMAFVATEPTTSGPDAIWQFVREVGQSESLADDFSVLEVTLG